MCGTDATLSGLRSRIPTGFHHLARRCDVPRRSMRRRGHELRRGTPPRGSTLKGLHRLASSGGQRTRDMMQPRWGWRLFWQVTQGSRADAATRGLNDRIPLGFATGRSSRSGAGPKQEGGWSRMPPSARLLFRRAEGRWVSLCRSPAVVRRCRSRIPLGCAGRARGGRNWLAKDGGIVYRTMTV
jgi:hypothetical protein